MKKIVSTILIICLAISTFTFAFLWNAEKSSRDDMQELAQAAAFSAYNSFVQYYTSGNVARYWDGVASFYTFQQAYRSAFNGTDRADNYLICNEVYGYLIAEPEISQKHIRDIVITMEYLSEDINDTNGHRNMLNLLNALQG
jgi:hypothetical protein